MSKITICEGEILYTSKGDTIIHAFDGNITSYAQGKNMWEGENGTLIGDYEPMDLPKAEDMFASLPNIILNFIRADKGHLGNFVDNEFEENGWHIIDSISLKDAFIKLKSYLGEKKADNIYLNMHGLVSERYTYDEKGELIPDNSSNGRNGYKVVGDTGFYTTSDKVLGSGIKQYISDKSKLEQKNIDSIENLLSIAKFINSGKNLVIGACWSARYDDLLGEGISSIVKSIDVFINRDYSSNYFVQKKGVIPFNYFITYNQTIKKNYIQGWVCYKDGKVTQRNFNIIMTKYGVKTIK